ncbi:MAG: DNA-processing protein DprA [Verrucomicrobia bacterium]|nr:DNA-processing protein DprA [Verrucomicrobiota bacterium]
MDERNALILLNMMEHVGPVCVRALVSHLGSAAAIMEANESELKGAKGVGAEITRAITNQRDVLDVDAECTRADALGARILTAVDSEYPASLKEIHDPPLALYVLGALENNDAKGIAVIGTRRPTHYGRDVARQFSGQLARMRFTILSGLALGIDTVAHQAALDANGRTVAVLGSALDTLYPPANAALAQEIAQKGAVISELPLGRRPDKTTFPMRNRIVSGMSMGVLVVEAGHKSGALITARQANEQGRTVFAVPGRIDAPGSQGCLSLIRDGATMVACIDDILREYEFLNLRMEDAPKMNRPAPVLDADETAIVDLLKHEEQHVDALIRASGLSASRISTLLLVLEMKKVVRMLPGKLVALAPLA